MGEIGAVSHGDRGMLMVYTGQGKGKTTAALGLAMRAVGQGMRVLMVQFIKGTWPCGEKEVALLIPNFHLKPMGLGFTWDRRHTADEHRAAIRRAWETSRQAIASGDYDLIVLDELNNVFNIRDFRVDDVLPLDEVLSVLARRPAHVHVLVTGRGAPPALVAMADLVTEMVDVKHPLHEGRTAARGIDF